MKNMKVLIEREDVHNHVRSLWKTPEFQKSHDEKGFVFDVIDRFAEMPRFFFDASDNHKETAHFSSWWGGTMNRQYDNDAIHDLYLLHEIYHTATMIYVPGLEFENFKRKMFDNELGASVCSEIQAYFEMPGLRAKSFPHEIFADRFLNSPYYQKRWQADPKGTIAEIALLRRNVMSSQTPRDSSEYWIRKFAAQNDGWAAVWSHRYDQVETAMAALRDDSMTIGRRAAMKKFAKWLTSNEVTDGSAIPFAREAVAFAGIYWQNKGEYQAAIKKNKDGMPELTRPASGPAPAP